MWLYARTFVIAGVLLPIVLHLVAPQSMPWWPDAATLGVAFGVAAVLIAQRHESIA